MCGIAGFSLHPSSKINARLLAHELLSAIETRGSDASGFAYVKGNETGVYKNAVPGSHLPLTELPRRADTVILHTRYATQGRKEDNRNNHPVLSPDSNIALVHNGVISNDYQFRSEMGGEFEGLAAVDTAVIPATIERYGLKAAAATLEGYAAIAYIDSRDEERSTLHLARLDYSPVFFTWLYDGSFVFASTHALLAGALNAAHLEHGHVFDLPEEAYFKVVGGVVRKSRDDISMQEDFYTRSKFANATAGGHSTGSTNVYGIGSSFGEVEFDDDSPTSDIDTPGFVYNPETKQYEALDWDNDYRNRDVSFDDDEIAMAMRPETNKPDFKALMGFSGGDKRVWKTNADGEAEVVDGEEGDLQGFYISLEDGTLDYFPTIEEVEARLDWLCNLSLWNDAPYPETEHKLKWTNFVIDLGEIRVNGGLDSWVEDMSLIDAHENPSIFNLNYIRQGVKDIMSWTV